MSEIFILGSGFSKAINKKMPTLKELGEVLNSYILNSPANNETDKYLKNLYGDLIIKTNISNFEELLTYLYQGFLWNDISEKYLLKALYIYVLNKLNDILFYKQISQNYKNNDNLIKFINYLHIKKACVLTFNYDTILETATKCILGDKLISLNDLYPIYIEPMYIGELPPKSIATNLHIESFSLYKLHGSVNWFHSYLDDGNINRIYLKEDIGDKVVKFLKGKVPVIIPPVFNKNNFLTNNIFDTLWKEAKERIREADIIYALGYSFPETDLEFKLLLKTCIKKNTVIYPVDKDLSVKEKLLNLSIKGLKIYDSFLIKDDNIIYNFIKNLK